MKYDVYYNGKRFDKIEDAVKQIPAAPPSYPIYFDPSPMAAKVKIVPTHPDAVLPKYATPGAAGFDIYAVEDVIIQPGETKVVPIGLAFEIPFGYELQIRPRSGISLKTPLRIANSPGTIDSDFRSEVCALVWNSAETLWEFDEDINEYFPIFAKTVFTIDEKEVESPSGEVVYGAYIIRKGERFAQGVIAPVVRAQFEIVDKLSETERGGGAFGSTGTR
nr:dUTP diphosphatase [Thermoactinomyces daqus]